MTEKTLLEREIFSKSVRECLSSERLDAFKRDKDTDDVNAIARYLWNVALCESLYPCLSAFEVTLRNAVHHGLSQRYGNSWLTNARLLRRYEQDKVREAQDTLLKLQKPIEAGRLVAELPLGFWSGLFVHQYDQQIAIPLMQTTFRRFPTAIRNRRALSERFEKVRYLRNRVSHLEPIWYWTDLPDRHAAILDDIGFLNPTMQMLTRLQDRFLAVHTLGWQHYHDQIKTELLLPPATAEPADLNPKP